MYSYLNSSSVLIGNKQFLVEQLRADFFTVQRMSKNYHLKLQRIRTGLSEISLNLTEHAENNI